MRIRVRLFAAARQLAQSDVMDVELPAPATIADVRRSLSQQTPALAPLLPHVRFAVGTEYAGENTPVADQSEVACIPPVSGG